MSPDKRSADEILGEMADSNPGLMEELVGRHVENVRNSGLSAREHALVRLASLVTVACVLTLCACITAFCTDTQ